MRPAAGTAGSSPCPHFPNPHSPPHVRRHGEIDIQLRGLHAPQPRGRHQRQEVGLAAPKARGDGRGGSRHRGGVVLCGGAVKTKSKSKQNRGRQRGRRRQALLLVLREALWAG